MKEKVTKVEPHPTHFRDAKENTGLDNLLNTKIRSSEEEVHGLRKQVEELKAQVEGLKRYAIHSAWGTGACNSYCAGECTCGLDAFL